MPAIDPDSIPESIQTYFSDLIESSSEDQYKMLALVWNRSWEVAQGVDRVD